MLLTDIRELVGVGELGGNQLRLAPWARELLGEDHLVTGSEHGHQQPDHGRHAKHTDNTHGNRNGHGVHEYNN